MYRHAAPVCLVCEDAVVAGSCARCQGPVCVAHMPSSDARCAVCEHSWAAAAQPLRTIGRGPLLVLIAAWCLLGFVLANANYIPSMQWVVSIAFALTTAAFLVATQLNHIRVTVQRARFMRERLDGPALCPAEVRPARTQRPLTMRRRRRRAHGADANARWKLQKLCR